MIINDEPKMLDKFDQVNYIEIWEPRYRDQRVLINPAKVGLHNKIVFTKAPSLTGVYYLSGANIKKYKKESNGSISCWAVPIADLRPLVISQHSLHEIN